MSEPTLTSCVTRRKYSYGATIRLADGRKGIVLSRYKYFDGQWRYMLSVR